jgi:large subunit ribosomal protein L3
MTQVFDEKGNVRAATVLFGGPITVTQMKTVDADGYQAAQVGFGKRSDKNTAKAQKGHTGDLGNFRWMREFRDIEGVEKGTVIDVTTFSPGDTVTVVGITKGKGFQGGVKRHGFAGAPRSHGHKQSERRPGSIGMRWPQRVLKNKRMAGRMGGDVVTVKGLKVLQVDKATNTLLVSGAIPGRPGTLIQIRG